MVEPQTIELPADALEQLAGVYLNKYGEETHIEVKDGRLVHKVPAYQFEEPIFPLSTEEYCPKANVFYRLRFLSGEGGKVNAFEAVNPYGRVQETMQKIEKETGS